MDITYTTMYISYIKLYETLKYVCLPKIVYSQ